MSALATAVDPQGSLYNVRLLPLWFISVYLMAAWAFGTGCIAVATAWRRARERRWEEATEVAPWSESPSPRRPWEEPRTPGEIGVRAPDASSLPGGHHLARWGPAAVSGAVIGLLAVMAAVVPPFVVPASWLPVTLGPNEVTNWSNYNYQGYEGQASYPEYKSIIETMESVSKRYGCGREMWEYSSSEDRFGTPEALMLLPYWTNGCIDSMEGLLFESSATTPYHFLNQAELSAAPSEPEVGLPYGAVDVTLGVEHLQLLGVKYFMAETPEVEQEAAVDPSLQLVAKTGPWTYDYNGAITHTTWDIYLVKDSLARHPSGQRPGRPLGRQAGTIELARERHGRGAGPELVRRPRQMGRRAGPERAPGLAPHPGDPRPPDRQTRRDHSGHRRHSDRLHRQLPCLTGRDAGPGQGLLLPQLARDRRGRSVARHAQSHGGRAHQPRRDPHLRVLWRGLSRVAGHPDRAGRPGWVVRRADRPPLESQEESRSVEGAAKSPIATPTQDVAEGQEIPVILITVDGAEPADQLAPPLSVPTGAAVPPAWQTSAELQPTARKSRCATGTAGVCPTHVIPPSAVRTIDCAGELPTATQTCKDGHETPLNCVLSWLNT